MPCWPVARHVPDWWTHDEELTVFAPSTMKVDSHPALRSCNFTARGDVFNAPDNTGNPPSVVVHAPTTLFCLFQKKIMYVYMLCRQTTMFPVTVDHSLVSRPLKKNLSCCSSSESRVRTCSSRSNSGNDRQDHCSGTTCDGTGLQRMEQTVEQRVRASLVLSRTNEKSCGQIDGRTRSEPDHGCYTSTSHA